MQTQNLYKSILIDPIVDNGANELYIVSGYASATFVRRHLLDLDNYDFKIKLIIGMNSKKSDHLAYLNLHEEFPNKFEGYYLDTTPSVHSKVYGWFKEDLPKIGYSGSGNYSQGGFMGSTQVNQFNEDSPSEIKDFYHTLRDRSIYIPEYTLDETEIIHSPSIEGSVPSGAIQWIDRGVSVRISFLDRYGQVPGSSGLNWGHRTTFRRKKNGDRVLVTRDPNEAYLSLKKDSRQEGFLPAIGQTFTLLTDDGIPLDCTVGQEGRKGVSTTYDNKILGRYIRTRLGLSEGTFITVDHLTTYGRTDYTITKIDDENFLFDFSV